MREPKNWLVALIIGAIITFAVTRIGGCLLPDNNVMTVKLDQETIKLLKENQKSELKIFIEGKETKVSKPNSDGEVKIKVSEENDGKKAELKVVDKEGKDLKKKDIVLDRPKPPAKGFPITITTPDNFKFEFTDIEWKDNEIKMNFKTTNLGDKDRELKLNIGSSICYTDVGTQHGVRKYCFNEKKCTTYYRNTGKFVGDVKNKMPVGIFLNCSLNTRNIDENATTIKRLIIGYNKGKKLELTDIKLPPK